MPAPDASRISIALAKHRWPDPAVSRVTSIVASPGFAGVLTKKELTALQGDASRSEREVLLALTAVAALYAEAPISRFHVGAVASGASGRVYLGCNVEYRGLPLGFCSHAEQGAITNAWLHGEQRITSLAVNAAPCGHCRQYLHEIACAPLLEVILEHRTVALSDLLPVAFGPGDVTDPPITARLLDPQSHDLVLAVPSTDPAVLAALEAANGSWAPYTGSFSGVGVLMNDGSTFRGPLAENAAFNPSLPPVNAAMSALRIAGRDFSEISRVALVEVRAAKVSQLEATRAVLSAVGGPPLVHAEAVGP